KLRRVERRRETGLGAKCEQNARRVSRHAIAIERSEPVLDLRARNEIEEGAFDVERGKHDARLHLLPGLEHGATRAAVRHPDRLPLRAAADEGAGIRRDAPKRRAKCAKASRDEAGAAAAWRQ